MQLTQTESGEATAVASEGSRSSHTADYTQEQRDSIVSDVCHAAETNERVIIPERRMRVRTCLRCHAQYATTGDDK